MSLNSLIHRPLWRLTLTAVLVVVLASGLAFAQDRTGDIYGKVTDDQGLGIPGATVTVTSPAHIKTEIAVTGNQGNYRAVRLSPGSYTVKVELSGFRTVSNQEVVLLAGQSIAINATLSPAAVEETITVTGESPLVDVKNVQVMRTLETELLDNIPNGRKYADLLTTVAGVLDAEYGFTPAQTVHGSSPRDNLYNIDGAALNDTTVGYIATEIPIDMIEEVQITTSGISAEHGLATGGVFNFVTKSGGNDFSGTANFFYEGEGLTADNLTPELAEQIPQGSVIEKNQEIGGTIGGPIKRDSVWFFFNLRRTEVDVAEPFLPPGSPRSTNQTHSFTKATWQAHANTRIEGSLTTRDQDQNPGNVRSFSNADAPETWEILKRSQRIIHLAATHVFSQNTLMDVRFNRVFKNFDREYPNNPDLVVGYNDIGTNKQFGGQFDRRGLRRTLARDIGQFHVGLSNYQEDLGGSHQFKAGFYAERSPFDNENFWPNGEDIEQRLSFGEAHRVRLCVCPQDGVKSSIDRYAAYFQDQWTITDRVTLNAGIRWEGTEGWIPEQSAGGGRFFALETQEELRDQINLSTFAPRLGVAIALDEGGRSTLKASYGRYYAMLLNQTVLRLVQVGGYEEYRWNDLNGDLVFQEGELGALTRGRSAGLRESDPDLKQQYVDNFNVTFEQQFGRDFVFSVAGIIKRENDIIETADIGRPFSAYNEVTVTNPVDGQPINIFVLDPSFLGSPSVTFITNPRDPIPLFRDFNALELVFQKRFREGWQMLASYTWSSSYGNIGNSYGSSSGGNRVYDNPNTTLINVEGPLDMDVPHAFKLQGTYVFPHDVWVSAYYQGLSGFPLKLPQDFPSDPALGARTVRYFRDDVPEMVVESFIDIAGTQRGSERHDFKHLVNFRAEKKFNLGGGTRIGIIADVFNLFNSSRVTTVQSLRIDLPQFHVPARIEFARRLRIGLRFEF
jgi:hypothetical protein